MNDKSMHFYLIGMMGAGKTFIGKKLAAIIDMKFIDLDAFIEAGEKKSISELFNNLGEEGFRDIETKYLKLASVKEKHIISLGGGTLIRKVNRDIVSQSGVSIYLACSLSTLEKRLSKETEHRPLLNVMKLRKTLLLKLLKRSFSYESSDIIINGDEQEMKIINEITRKIAT